LRQTGSPDGALNADADDAQTGSLGFYLEPSSGGPSSAELFDILWRSLADILGTAAAAALLRRAAQRALPRWPELTALCITRERLEYRYSVPSSWDQPVRQRSGALSEIARALWPLLTDLTGSVVVQRLAQIPELRDSGILPQGEAQ
jgi:hypothetical protein